MAGNWRVSLVRDAKAELDALTGRRREEALDVLTDLSEDPFPPGAVPLRRNNWLWRLRFDSERWRMIYRVDERKRTVAVVRIRPRGTAYKGLRNPLS